MAGIAYSFPPSLRSEVDWERMDYISLLLFYLRTGLGAESALPTPSFSPSQSYPKAFRQFEAQSGKALQTEQAKGLGVDDIKKPPDSLGLSSEIRRTPLQTDNRYNPSPRGAQRT